MIQSKLFNQFPEIYHAFLTKGETTDSINIIRAKSSLVRTKQVHSGTVVMGGANISLLEADGILLKEKGWAGVSTADCIPILLYDPVRKIAGAIHAGWKGLSRKIAGNAIAAMKRLGCKGENIYAVIGPHIGMCCYHVPDNRISVFAKMGLDKKIISQCRNGKWYLSLGKIALLQIRKEGIPDLNIDMLSICTYTTKNLYSYRREGNQIQVRPINNVIGFI